MKGQLVDELKHWTRQHSQRGNVMFSLKQEAMVPLDVSLRVDDRYLRVFTVNGRVFINQSDEPHNPSMSMEAFAELVDLIVSEKETATP